MLKIRSERTLFTQKKTFGAVYKCVCVSGICPQLSLFFFCNKTQCDIFTNFVSSKYFSKIDTN